MSPKESRRHRDRDSAAGPSASQLCSPRAWWRAPCSRAQRESQGPQVYGVSATKGAPPGGDRGQAVHSHPGTGPGAPWAPQGVPGSPRCAMPTPSIAPRASSQPSRDTRGHKEQPSSAQGRWEGTGHPAWGTFGCHQAPQARPGAPGQDVPPPGRLSKQAAPLPQPTALRSRIPFPNPIPGNSPPQGCPCAPKPLLGRGSQGFTLPAAVPGAVPGHSSGAARPPHPMLSPRRAGTVPPGPLPPR